MSALPPKAEVARRRWHFRYVPTTDMRAAFGDCHHELIADAAQSCQFGFLISINALPVHSASWEKGQ